MENISSLWNLMPPATQVVVRDALCALAAYLVGRRVGDLLKTVSAEKGIDRACLPPWAAESTEEELPITASSLLGIVSAVTVWAGGLFALFQMHGQTLLARQLRSLIGNLWGVALTMALALLCASWLLRAVTELLGHPAVGGWLDARFPSAESDEARPFSHTLLRATGAAVYGLFGLIGALAAAEIAGLKSAVEALSAFWMLAISLLGAAAALGIGWIGVSWARRTEEQPLIHLVVGATGLSIVLLISGHSAVVGLTVVAVGAYLLREQLSDAWSGMQLSSMELGDVALEDGPARVDKIGLLEATLVREGEEPFERRNSEVLEAINAAAA